MTNDELSSNEKMVKINCGVRPSHRNLEFPRHLTFVIRHFPTFACRGHVISASVISAPARNRAPFADRTP